MGKRKEGSNNGQQTLQFNKSNYMIIKT